jgi:hypothetical protein
MDAPESPRPESDLKRSLVVVLLRTGLGVHLLNAGLVGYVSSRNGALSGNNLFLPQAQICLGLALVMGLFTTAAAVAAGLLAAVHPLLRTALAIGEGLNGGMPGAPQVETLLNATETTTQLLLAAAVIWLSGPHVNRWSLDAALFTPRSRRAAPHTAAPVARDEPVEAPPPGERTAKFLANRDK